MSEHVKVKTDDKNIHGILQGTRCLLWDMKNKHIYTEEKHAKTKEWSIHLGSKYYKYRW